MKNINLRSVPTHDRADRYKIDTVFESILANVNERLLELEYELTEACSEQELPIVVISFAPRAGSTYLSQLIARTARFNYITNFMARFWDAPYIAGLLEKKLRLRNVKFEDNIRSDYGVTNGPNEPHEFGFFWNKWLKRSNECDIIELRDIDKSSKHVLEREIWAVMSLYDQPFFIKNGLIGLNTELMRNLFQNVKFAVLKRNPLFMAQSIYKARIDLYSDIKVNLSLYPSNFAEIRDLPTAQQIALQIRGCYDDIYRGISKTGADYTEIFYEDLCRQPKKEVHKILKLAEINDDIVAMDGKLVRSHWNHVYLDKKIIEQLDYEVRNVFDQDWFLE